jgi:hypothetical protein
VNACPAADRSGLGHQRNIDKVRDVHGEIKQVISAKNK